MRQPIYLGGDLIRRGERLLGADDVVVSAEIRSRVGTDSRLIIDPRAEGVDPVLAVEDDGAALDRATEPDARPYWRPRSRPRRS